MLQKQNKSCDFLSKERIRFLGDNWFDIEDKVIRVVWKNFKSKLISLGIEYSDYINISYLIIEHALKSYNPEKSNFYTYAVNSLKRKTYTYIRDISERDKTKINYMCTSLDGCVSEDGKLLLADTIADKNDEDNTSIEKVCNYIRRMSSIQKNIIILKVLGFDDDDIKEALPISQQEYTNAIKSIQASRNTSILRKRRIS